MQQAALPCFRSSRTVSPIPQSGRPAGIRRLQGPSARPAATFRVMARQGRGGSSQWLSPSWNWGYADGDAHDLALKTRSKLSSPSSRQEWLNNVLQGEVDIAEVEMTLALKWQKVARERRGGNPEVWWQFMNDMSDGRFVGESGSALLANELADQLPLLGLNDTSAPAAASEEAPSGDNVTAVCSRAVQVLEGLDFVKHGL